MRIEKGKNMATYLDALWLLGYARSTPPEIAAQNNNGSGRKFILQCFNGAVEHWTENEQEEMKPWCMAFLQEARRIQISEIEKLKGESV